MMSKYGGWRDHSDPLPPQGHPGYCVQLASRRVCTRSGEPITFTRYKEAQIAAASKGGIVVNRGYLPRINSGD